ncbi:MAG: hypothetical protein JO316_00150 [Abitibacteriaceae bacterium]|nr:hypothetical protein [Abditibacteriaceae bacterium]
MAAESPRLGQAGLMPVTGASASATAVEVEESGGVTPRVVALCLALAAVLGYVIPIIDVKLSNTFLGAAHLPPGAIAVLLIILLVINPLVRLLSMQPRGTVVLPIAAVLLLGAAFLLLSAARDNFLGWACGVLGILALVGCSLGRRALSRNEVLTVYISCLFSALVPGHGAENFFLSNIIGPFYFATRENKWLSFLEPNLRPWFTPALMHGGRYDEVGKAVVQGWYVGGNQAVPWSAWLVPLAAWGVFVFASYFMLGCLSVMLRAQWAEREALAFPLLRLPLDLTEDVDRRDKYGVFGQFFRNPLMWIGFGLGVAIQLFKGLHVYFADVPDIPLEILTGPLFTEPPWNQIGWVPMQIFPIAVGITFLLTSEVSFSLWFFYWFMRFELVVAYYTGFMPNSLPGLVGSTAGAKTFTGYQHIGAYIGYVAIVLWTGREHFIHIARRAFGRAPAGEGERREALSYPVAFWGFVLSFVFMVAWSVLAGMTLSVALVLWLIYLMVAIALTRVVAEGGLLFVQHGWSPLGSMAQIFNSGPGKWLSPQNLVPGSILQGAFITDLRAFLMPSFIQSFKLAYDRKINMKPLLALIFSVIVITLVVSLYMDVRFGYEKGGLQLEGWFANSGAQKPAGDANALINGVTDASWTNLFWVGLGIIGTYGLMLARSRFLWFPLHPIGFLMAITYPMNRLWFSIFLGWMCKVLISRFGGSETYRKTTPMFLGLALGDVAMMLVWLVIDAWQARTGHQLMPS